MYKYYLGLGSNIEPRLEYIKQACIALGSIGMIIQKSSLYETEPLGKKDQSEFYNAVVAFESSLLPQDLLSKVKQIETKIGRLSNQHWGPREIDIDILLCDDQVVNDADLQIPHREFSNRRFVLQPMAELKRDYRVPDKNRTIEDLVDECQDSSTVQKLDINW